MISSPLQFILLIFFVTSYYTSCHAQEQQDDDKLRNMFGSQNQVCQTVSCPKPYVPLHKWHKTGLGLTSTGCQSNNGMGMVAMGGENAYKHIEQCCHIKNACYQLCGSNKQACDKELEKCMEKGCTELSDLTSDELSKMTFEEKQKETDECNKMKGIVVLMNNMGGCNEYEAEQQRTCECIEKEKVKVQIERVIYRFYKKFNQDGIPDKVNDLLGKADGNRSTFTKILYGLVKKYDKAIKKKKAPDMMDQMKMDL